MIVEVVAVGTELLLGQIVNTNSSHIGSVLADHGLDAHFQQVVGDNLGRVATAITTAMERADAVIITGGIGPTRDDLTREALCLATGREMVDDEGYAERLRRWWEERGREMPESNLRQAQHPAGAELVANPKGTAPALVLDHQGSTNPSVAFLASRGEIKVRITAKADSRETANALIEPVAAEVGQRLAPWLFGADDETVLTIIFRALSERGWTIGTAESMTGMSVAAALTSEPGASAWVRGGLVAYDHELKGRLLGVSDLATVVDVETAMEMAEGGRKLLEADVVIAVTGSAGPDPLEKPPGTVVIAVATPVDVRGQELRMPGDRERVRAYGTTSALHLTRLAVTGKWWT